MKVYEYLAAGLPVVATPLPSLEGVEGVDTVDSSQAMVERLEELLADRPEDDRARRARLAEGHSWETRLTEIAAALDS